MNRLELLRAATAGAVFSTTGLSGAATGALPVGSSASPRLKPPVSGPVLVAMVMGADAVVIDFAGPWEVFEGATFMGMPTMKGSQPPGMPWPKNQGFELAMVSHSVQPLKCEGMTITPQYSFETFPRQPNVIVIPQQGDANAAKIAWIREASNKADVVMSIGTGAFLLAKTGLLDGLSATTHHEAYDEFIHEFPSINLERDVRLSTMASSLARAGCFPESNSLFTSSPGTTAKILLERRRIGWSTIDPLVGL